MSKPDEECGHQDEEEHASIDEQVAVSPSLALVHAGTSTYMPAWANRALQGLINIFRAMSGIRKV